MSIPTFSVNPSIAEAHTIHTDAYTSPAVFEAAKEKIFAQSWQFIGDTDVVPTNGSAYPHILLEGYINEPLLLTRDREGMVHCLSNVCTHRGNLMVTEPCDKLRQLTCKYHGRAFQLDGTFKFMPEFKEVENFPTEADHLHKLPLFQWGKLLFTTLTPSIAPETYFKPMLERVGWLPMDSLQYDHSRSQTYTIQANWALYCENYLEGFHIPFVHAGLNEVLDFGNYSTEVFPYCNLQLGIAKEGDVCFELPPTSPDYGKRVAAYYFWVFPNMMFNFYPWGLSLNIVEPTSVSTCKVRFLSYVYDAEKLGQGAGAALDTVELEDEAIVEQVQRGVRSRFYTKGRYSVKHEQGTHHFHQLLAAFLR